MSRSGASSAREKAALGLFVAVVLGASALPYGLAWRATPPGRVYVGTTEASQDDYPTYLARMRAGAQGRLFGVSPYDPGGGSALRVRPLYAALGAVTGAAGLPLPAGYHAGRLLAGAAALLAIFLAAKALARGAEERWTAFALATIGSGVGVLLGREGPRSAWSYDLWVPELNTVHGLLTNPHFPAAIALLLAAFAGAARAIDAGRPRPALLAGAALAALAFIHTYDLVIAAGVLGVYGVAAAATGAVPLRRLGAVAGGLALVSLPAVAWQLAAYLSDSSLAQMAQRQPVGSPLRVATGAGLLAPLALLGIPRLAHRSAFGGIVAVWALVIPLLLALPLPFARRLVAGWHVPLGLAAGVGLAGLAAAIHSAPLRRLVLTACVALASLTTFHHFVHQSRRFAQPDPGVLASLPRELLDAYAWLDAHAGPGDVVLAEYGPSVWLPVYTDLRPYFGHWAEAPDAARRAARAAAFFSRRAGDSTRRALLAEAPIAWVLDTPAGRPPGSSRADPARLESVSPAARFGHTRILRVSPQPRAQPRSRAGKAGDGGDSPADD